MSSEPLLSFVAPHLKREGSRQPGPASNGKATKQSMGKKASWQERKHWELSRISQEVRDSITPQKQERMP